MTIKNAMVTVFSLGFLAASSMVGGTQTTSLINSSQDSIFVSDSDSTEIAERGSGRIEPGATSGVVERHSYS